MDKKTVEKLLAGIDRCAKCGKCRMICPVFRETLDEKLVARARITLAESFLAGELRLDDELAELWKSCVKCARCGSICPSDVHGDEIAMGLAAVLNKSRQPTPVASFFKTVVSNRPAFDAFMLSASLMQRFLPPKRGGTLRHLPLAVMGKSDMPLISPKSALHQLPRRIKHKKQDTPKARVGLFLGCAINYVYPNTAKSIVNLLTSSGFDVIIPREQLCCGTPALTMGLVDEALLLANNNCRVFTKAGVEAVITGCASCALTLSRNYDTILGEGRIPPVFELSQFLCKMGFEPAVQDNTTVAYHDPCHLRHGLGIKKEPRTLLKSSANLVELKDEDRCCGGGGSFAFFNPDLSSALAQHKVAAMKESNAQMMITACPGCVLQLREHFERSGVNSPVLHIADFLMGRREE